MTRSRLPRAVAVRAAVSRLHAAAAQATPCAPVRDVLGTSDIALAYEVQQQLVGRRLAHGRRAIGRKVGLTSTAVQAQLGVDQPDFGVLLDDMCVADGDTVAMSRLLQPKAEAEIGFVLAADLDHGPLDLAQVRAAVGHAVAALEIVDSRVSNWDICITDTVADNASSGLFVLGSTPVGLNVIEPSEVEMILVKDGVQVSTGNGRACLGDPLAAVVWLARTAHTHGSPLRSGDIVLSGALGPMVDVTPGCTITATLTELGSVTVSFGKEGS